MRRLLLFISALLVVTIGCLTPIPPSITVTLETPQNNSTVPSLTPNFSWSTSIAASSFSLQVATDNNFQNLVINATGITQPQYQTPSSTLSANQTYYWRVSASRDSQTSGWSAVWSFNTGGSTSKGAIIVNATLDGAPWSGSLTFTISGQTTYNGVTVPASFNDVAADSYTLTYNYGGPDGATLSNISPSPTQQLTAGENINFTLNFNRQSTSSVVVVATLNGAPWSGQVNYTINGPILDSNNNVPSTFSNMPPGNYTITYNYGGPTGAQLASISPAPTQALTAGGSISFSFNFHTQASSSIIVNATNNGAPWSGVLNFTISGPYSDSQSSVPSQFNNLPPGQYTLTYNYGGPPNATLFSIIPSPTQSLSAGGTITFTLNFSAQSSGEITINATLDGTSWSGPLNFTVQGPYTDSGSSVPSSSSNVPAGNYTLVYNYGGPSGAQLTSITPSPFQSMPAGGNISFTLNFHRQQSTGTIIVNATLDGKSWSIALGSGTVSYTIVGPKVDSSNMVPATFSNMPDGTYSFSYNSGGPIGASLASITPAPAQNLQPGGTIVFTMNFRTQERGTITVSAVLNGEPWSGSVSYVLNGPYVQSGYSVPQNFSSAPPGTYSVNYRSGGPPESRFEGVQPSQQNLGPGGNISFTILFSFLPGPIPEPEPMPGPLLK